MGLRTSQHVGRIVIHPEDPEIVYVAAVGPLWAPGGERGLFRTMDGGESWEAVLTIDEHTGVTDIVMDPTNPDILYAASLQRERRAYSYVGGGPGSGIHKSIDGGDTWTRLTRGLPASDMGRIGLDISLSHPQTVLRRDRGLRTGRLPHRQRRPGVAADERHRLDSVVLRTDPRRPAGPRSRLSPGRPAAAVDGRRRDLELGPRAGVSTSTTTPCGSTRKTPPTSCSATTAASTSRTTSATPGTSRPTCRSASSTAVGIGHAGTLLRHLRRPAGQLDLGRSERHAQQHRRRQRRLVPDAGRRRLLRGDRPERPQHRLRGIAEREPCPLQRPHR